MPGDQQGCTPQWGLFRSHNSIHMHGSVQCQEIWGWAPGFMPSVTHAVVVHPKQGEEEEEEEG